MRKIKAIEVTNAVKKLFLDCNYYIGDDCLKALEKARDNEDIQSAKEILSQIIENDKIAAKNKVPMCQDTGMAIVFVEYGDKVIIEDGNFEDSVNEGIRQAYIDGYLRKSVVFDPVFDRINTKDNTPGVIHTKIVPGDFIRITAGGKGFGSENMSKIKMLTPAYGVDGVKEFILETVKEAGPNPCPPIVVGVGIGGTFEASSIMAKKATFLGMDYHNEDVRYAELENELLEEINKMGFGPAGLGGKTTALKVNILTMPTHIAGMPVAVNICCHACRHKTVTL